MKLETVGGYHVIDAVDQARFRDDVENLWVCECTNES